MGERDAGSLTVVKIAAACPQERRAPSVGGLLLPDCRAGSGVVSTVPKGLKKLPRPFPPGSVVRILLLPAPMSSSVDAECVCIICYASVPPPIQSGCACRSDSGLAHVDCLIAKAVSQQAHRGSKVWWKCQTCEQRFTGAMRTGLGEAWWSRVRGEAEESAERRLGACARESARGSQARHGLWTADAAAARNGIRTDR